MEYKFCNQKTKGPKTQHLKLKVNLSYFHKKKSLKKKNT